MSTRVSWQKDHYCKGISRQAPSRWHKWPTGRKMWRRRGLKPGFERSLRRVRHIPHEEFPRRSRPSSNLVAGHLVILHFLPLGHVTGLDFSAAARHVVCSLPISWRNQGQVWQDLLVAIFKTLFYVEKENVHNIKNQHQNYSRLFLDKKVNEFITL